MFENLHVVTDIRSSSSILQVGDSYIDELPQPFSLVRNRQQLDHLCDQMVQTHDRIYVTYDMVLTKKIMADIFSLCHVGTLVTFFIHDDEDRKDYVENYVVNNGNFETWVLSTNVGRVLVVNVVG